MRFPSEEDSDGRRVISDDTIARRLIGDGKIQVSGVIDMWNGGDRITDIKIGLDTNLTGLNNYYTKQEPDSKFENVSKIQVYKFPYVYGDYRFYKLGRLNLPIDGHQAIVNVNACCGWNTNIDRLANVPL